MENINMCQKTSSLSGYEMTYIIFCKILFISDSPTKDYIKHLAHQYISYEQISTFSCCFLLSICFHNQYESNLKAKKCTK